MAAIISVHSFRGGTGKSNLTANLAVLLAGDGRRVGIIDTDIQSPGIHILFGLRGDTIGTSLNDYLWHDRDIKDAAHDVTPVEVAEGGKVFLIPASVKPGEIARVLREGYDAQRLTLGVRRLIDELALDILIIDTHPGLNEETLLSVIISQTLIIVLRPDHQDYEGTGITVRVARGLDVPNMFLVVNKTPPSLDPNEVRANVERVYSCEVCAVLPHSDEMMDLASEGLFALRFPRHALTDQYRAIAARVMAD